MKKSKFSDVKVVGIVRESRVEGVAATARKHKISEQTVYLWHRKYGGMEATQVAELKRLGQENTRLKKLPAERDLAIEVMQEIAAKNGERVGAPGPGPIRTEAGHVVLLAFRAASNTTSTYAPTSSADRSCGIRRLARGRFHRTFKLVHNCSNRDALLGFYAGRNMAMVVLPRCGPMAQAPVGLFLRGNFTAIRDQQSAAGA